LPFTRRAGSLPSPEGSGRPSRREPLSLEPGGFDSWRIAPPAYRRLLSFFNKKSQTQIGLAFVVELAEREGAKVLSQMNPKGGDSCLRLTDSTDDQHDR
jgi:hypothetical protein